MKIDFTAKDKEIFSGVQELRAIAESDIKDAHGSPAQRIRPTQRTVDLYEDIIAAIERDRDENSN
jgi:hypothetical protein